MKIILKSFKINMRCFGIFTTLKYRRIMWTWWGDNARRQDPKCSSTMAAKRHCTHCNTDWSSLTQKRSDLSPALNRQARKNSARKRASGSTGPPRLGSFTANTRPYPRQGAVTRDGLIQNAWGGSEGPCCITTIPWWSSKRTTTTSSRCAQHRSYPHLRTGLVTHLRAWPPWSLTCALRVTPFRVMIREWIPWNAQQKNKKPTKTHNTKITKKQQTLKNKKKACFGNLGPGPHPSVFPETFVFFVLFVFLVSS